MCGLTGFSGKRNVDLNKLRILLLDNEARGKHSTGVHGLQMFKQPGSATELIQSPTFDMAANSNLVVGHTRFATMGAHTKENAHPYAIGEVIGTHNGWVLDPSIRAMSAKYDVPAQTVDSQFIYEVFKKTDYDFNVLSEFDGAVVLAFKKDNKLHLYKRRAKDLFFGEAPEGIYYSSRKQGLRMVGIPESRIRTLDDDTIVVFEDGVLIDQFSLEKPTVDFKLDCHKTSCIRDLSDDERKALTEKYPDDKDSFKKYTYSGRSYQRDFYNDDYYGGGGSQWGSRQGTTSTGSKKGNEVKSGKGSEDEKGSLRAGSTFTSQISKKPMYVRLNKNQLDIEKIPLGQKDNRGCCIVNIEVWHKDLGGVWAPAQYWDMWVIGLDKTVKTSFQGLSSAYIGPDELSKLNQSFSTRIAVSSNANSTKKYWFEIDTAWEAGYRYGGAIYVDEAQTSMNHIVKTPVNKSIIKALT